MTNQRINSDMTRGNLWKQMIIFSLPLMFSNVLQVLFNMADIAVVGRFSGSIALGGVGSTTMLVNLFVGFLIGTSGGINVLTARGIGGEKSRDVHEIVHTAFVLSLGMGILLSAFGVVLAKPILVLMNTKEELLQGAVTYFSIYMLGMPAVSLFNYGSGVLSAVGETKKPLYYLSFAGGLNVALNLFFVVVFKMSTGGVALASIISQYVSAILIIRELTRRKNEDICLLFSKIKVYPDKAKALAAISIPSGLQHAIFYVANLFVQVGINTFDAVTVAGNSAATNADGLVYDVMAAVYTAISSFVGQNFGAGNKKRVLHSFYIGTFYALAAGLVLGLAVYGIGNRFLYLFTTEAAVVAAGMKKLRVMGFTYWISSFMDGLIAANRGLGRSLIPMCTVIAGSCVFRIAWIYTVFAYFKTIESLYLLYAFSWTVTAIFQGIYFICVIKKEVKDGTLK